MEEMANEKQSLESTVSQLQQERGELCRNQDARVVGLEGELQALEGTVSQLQRERGTLGKSQEARVVGLEGELQALRQELERRVAESEEVEREVRERGS